MKYNGHMQCTVNLDRGCRALCSFGGKGDDNTHTSVQRNRFSRNQERSEQTGQSVRNLRQHKAASGVSSKDFRVSYSPQTTPQMSLSAHAGSRVITGQTSGYGGVIQRCGDPVDGSEVDYGKRVIMDDSTFDPNVKDRQGRTNIERMSQGLAPIGVDGQSVNLHHVDQTDDGLIREILATEHHKKYSDLHTNTGQEPSKIDRNKFRRFRTGYWIWRSKE